jgi:hypothetical protein
VSMKEKSVVLLAALGAYTLSADLLSFVSGYLLYALALSFGLAGTDVRLLIARVACPYLGLMPAGMLAAWLVWRRAWLYGTLAGILSQWPQAALTGVSLLRTTLMVLPGPESAIYVGPGTPSLGLGESWVLFFAVPALLPPLLGAIGGLLGQRLRQRIHAPSRGD